MATKVLPSQRQFKQFEEQVMNIWRGAQLMLQHAVELEMTEYLCRGKQVMNKRKLLHERASGQALVGVFVILAGLIFAWLLLGRGGEVSRYRITAGFNALNNVNEATKVKLRGFTIGQVEKISFRSQPSPGEPYFLLQLAIDDQYAIPRGTAAEIRSSGLVGDAFIHLDVSEATDGHLQPDDHIEGRDAPGMKQLISSITEMAHKLGGAGESIRRADLGYKLGRLGDSIHRIAENLDEVAGNADSLLITSRDVVAVKSQGCCQMESATAPRGPFRQPRFRCGCVGRPLPRARR